jgi:hypothetical protein
VRWFFDQAIVQYLGYRIRILIYIDFRQTLAVLEGTPTKRQVSKHQVSKRLVSKRPVSKRQVYKTSGLQNVRFQNVWFQNVRFQNVRKAKWFKMSDF